MLRSDEIPADNRMTDLLSCKDLPISRWFKYIDDDDYEHRQTIRYHSDNDEKDSIEEKRRRKVGKNARYR